jgi:hypothetical protein
MTARIGSGLEKPGKQGHVIRGKRFPTFRMPHHADDATILVPDRLDNSIIGNRPTHQWGVNLRRSEIMKAVDFDAPAIDQNPLAGSHMPVNFCEASTEAMLNHLHSPANTQNGQVPALGQIKKRSLGLISLGSIPAIGRQIIPTSKDDAADALADRHCGVHGIGNRNWKQSAPEEEFRPHLIETIATRAMGRVDGNPLGDSDGLHEMT